MKKSPILLMAALCGFFATNSAFGQVTYTWTNQLGGDISTAVNYNPNGQPSGATQDTAQWDGQTTGALGVYSTTTSLPSTGFGSSGINLIFTVNQLGSVTFTSAVATAEAAYGVNNIDIESPSAAITFGHPSLSSTYLYNFFGRPAGGVHAFINNSSQPATFNGNVRWQAGGGAAYTLDFQGTGNWVANNYLVNDNNAGMIIAVEGPGTMTWTPGGYLGNSGINSPIFINGGRMVLAAPHPRISNQAWNLNGGFFEFNAPAQAQTLSGVISGGGNLQVSSGTLTLSGQSTYTGSNILSGGEVILNGAENAGASGPLGVGNTISFKGGTLGYSVNNVFDYSGRFDTSSVQAFSIDTAGQNVTYTNAAGLSGSGSTLAKLGSGTLTLAGPSTYTGNTTVSVGRLVFQGSKTGSGSITVADGATLGVVGTGTQVTPGTLTVGSGTGGTLGFDNVNSTTTALIAAGTLTTAGTVTINVNSGPLVPGNSYPLLAWTSGSAPGVSLGVLNGFIGNLSTNGNSITLNVTATAYKWTGINNSSWDLITGNNWLQNGGPVVFANGGPVLFDDTATTTNVTISGVVQPSSVSVNNNSAIYTITSSSGNDLGGSASLTKNGSSSLNLSGGANTYTGVTTVSGGTLSVGALANGGVASDIGAASSSAANLVLDGGTLQYTGGAASVDRLFTVGTSGGAIDGSGSGALNLNNSATLGYSGNGPRTLTLTGTGVGNTLATAIGNNGGATALTKSGSGAWVLTGNNTYSGVTTIANGLLQVGAGGASGSLGSGNVVNSGGIDFNRTGSVTVSGAISGTGAVTNDGTGTVILAGNNSYTGGTVINAGTLQIGNGGATGKLDSASPIVDNGTLIFNSTSSLTIAGFNVGITGTGNVWVRGTGLFKEIGANAYTGWTLIDSGASFQVTEGNAGGLLSSVVTNNGTLIFGRQDNSVWGYSNNIVGTGKVLKEVNNTQGGGDITLAGTNSYTGGTYIAGGGIILGDGLNPGAGVILGSVIFTNSPVGDNPRILTFDRPDDFTFSNTIVSVATGFGAGNGGSVVQAGLNVVTLTGNNSYPGATTINAGATLQVGNGGTSGSLGTGGIVDNGVLIFNLTGSQTVSGVISGTGNLVKFGTSTLTLSGANTYTGATTVSNGTLIVAGGAVGGDLNVAGGTIASAASGTVKILNIGGNVNLDSGTVLATLNKSVAVTDPNLSVTVSNTYYSVSNVVNLTAGTITATGGTLKLINAGPQLAVGNQFTIFSGPVTGGAGLTIVSPGFTVANNLAVDGSVTVTSVLPPPTITTTVSGGNLTLTWPASWTGGVRVQNQTNALSKGLSTNWVTIPGTEASNSYTAPITGTNGSVFFRLAP